jgi:hypothetical protein
LDILHVLGSSKIPFARSLLRFLKDNEQLQDLRWLSNAVSIGKVTAVKYLNYSRDEKEVLDKFEGQNMSAFTVII